MFGPGGGGGGHGHGPGHGHGQRHLNPLEVEDAKDRADRAERRRSRLANALLDLFPKLIDFVMILAGPLLVLIAWGLFGIIVFVYFYHILPLLQLTSTTFPGCLVTGVGLFILFNLFYNHAMAVFTKPGTIPAHVVVPPDIDDLIAFEQQQTRRGEGFSVYCRHCRKPKPVRAHHCHICKQCVLKMDHHCPWVANCVGHGNYRYFFLFLLYLCVGCIFVTLLAAPPFIWSALTTPALKRAHENATFFALILCATASVAVGGMGALHLYLILTNQTTIELYHNRRQTRMAKARGEVFHNPFDLGRKKNFEAVFGVGRYWFSWLLPAKPPGDGVFFQTRDDDDPDPRIPQSSFAPAHAPYANGHVPDVERDAMPYAPAAHANGAAAANAYAAYGAGSAADLQPLMPHPQPYADSADGHANGHANGYGNGYAAASPAAWPLNTAVRVPPQA